MDNSIISEIGQQGLELAESIFTSYLASSLHDYVKIHKSQKLAKTNEGKQIIKHIAETYKTCCTIKTITFQHIPQNINNLYVPLRLRCIKTEEFVTLNNNFNFSKFDNHILISDKAGMGKSTATKWITKTLICRESSLPIFLELRSYDGNSCLHDCLLDTIGMSRDTDASIFDNLKCNIFLDGLDETPTNSIGKLIKEITQFAKDHPSTFLLVSSRNIPELIEFNNFTRFRIEPLRRKDSVEIIKKYDSNGPTSDKLIKDLESTKAKQIIDFLENPLYVTLLYCAYRHKSIIPQKRHLFYSQVFDALYESHDLTKEPGYTHQKLCKLDSNDFHAVLRKLGFWCLVKNNQLEFTKEDLTNVIGEIEKATPGINFSADNFVKDIVNSVPIFLRDGNIFEWSHRSLQEYFAAKYICMDTKTEISELLDKLYDSKHFWNFENTISLIADIDYSLFRNHLSLKSLKEFKSHYEKYLKDFRNKRVKQDQIDLRKSLTFACNTKIFYELGDPNRISDILENIKKLSELNPEFNYALLYRSVKPNRKLLIFGALTKDNLILRITAEKEKELQLDLTKWDVSTIQKLPNSFIDSECHVTDSHNAKCNQYNAFNSVNKCIYSLSHIAINYDSALRLIEKIESEKNDNFLNNLALTKLWS